MRLSSATWPGPAAIVGLVAVIAWLIVAFAAPVRVGATTAASGVAPNAFIGLDTAAGPATTVITVTGNQFLANEQITLYWDPPSTKLAGTVTTNANGNFTTTVKPYPHDALGLHRLCADVPPMPCANFTLEAAQPSPTPVASPSPQPSSTPLASPPSVGVVSAVRPTSTSDGLSLFTRPPFVFVPVIGAVALILALGYWLFSMFLRRPQPTTLPAAAVVHRATRPDYTAGFGAPPSAPAPEVLPSAWADQAPVLHMPPDAARPSAPEPPGPPPVQGDPPETG